MDASDIRHAPRGRYRRSTITPDYFDALLSDGGGGGVVELESAGGGGVAVLESGGVVVPEAGGVVEESAGGEVVDDWSLGVLEGDVDCCFEHADIATIAPRHKRAKLRFIDHLTV